MDRIQSPRPLGPVRRRDEWLSVLFATLIILLLAGVTALVRVLW